MHISDLIDADHIACGVQTGSKKRALEKLSELVVNDCPDISATEVFESLIGRERLGSTGLGKGIAIPHGRLKQSDRTLAAFMTLDEAVDFDAADDQPVDLLCALLVPPESTEEHLELLASLSEMFRDDNMRRQLREAASPQGIHEVIARWEQQRN